ncbi:hypothetical protein HN51_013009 [Arachis hypogaea]
MEGAMCHRKRERTRTVESLINGRKFLKKSDLGVRCVGGEAGAVRNGGYDGKGNNVVELTCEGSEHFKDNAH